MKKLLYLVFLLPLFIACNQKETGTFLSGTADNLESGVFILGGPGGARDSIKLNEDHSFRFDFSDITEPGNYYLLSEDDYCPIYVAPGMQLDVYFDKNDFTGSLNFGGIGADINNYKVDKMREADPAMQEAFKLGPNEFRTWADSLLAAQQSLLKDMPKDHKNDTFWMQEEGEILYSWALNLNNYPAYHKYYSGGEEVELPESFNSYKDDLDINNSKYLLSSSFKQYLNSAVRQAAAEQAEGLDQPARNLLNLKTAKEILTNSAVFNEYLVSTVLGTMQWTDLADMQGEIDFLMENCTDEAGLAKFNKEYEEWKKLASGQPAVPFEGKDRDGNVVKLADFAGKYVYVDVWATWCGPCKYEIPFLKQLEADYHERNIVFLSYSIDEDKEAWLKFVPENELGGVQIIGENAWESKLCKDYKIMGVPTFMFFGPDGNIINAKMSRPSSQATRDKFDSYTDL